jgi:hypothetical protein
MDEFIGYQVPFGFQYGAAKVTRVCHDRKKGWVVLDVTTPRAQMQVYVTRTGMIKTYKVRGAVKQEDLGNERPFDQS